MIRSGVEAMLFVLACLLVWSRLGEAEPQYYVRCSNKTNITTFKPAEDGVQGRYVFEWCTNADEVDEQWHTEVAYNPKNLSACVYRRTHSSTDVHIAKKPPNCSHVCLGTYMDLIFSACYVISTGYPNLSSKRTQSVHNVSNGLTLKNFQADEPSGIVTFHDDYVSVHYFTKLVPFPDITVTLTKKRLNSEVPLWWKDVTNHCAVSQYDVRCKLDQLSDGNYSVGMTLDAPWLQGNLVKTHFVKDFSVAPARAAGLDSSAGTGAALVWASGALVALCACALALLLALRWRSGVAARKHVLHDWLTRKENKSAVAKEPQPAVGPILLLYARECPQAEPVTAALRDLLETVAPEQVYDINDPQTIALAAPGGGEWIRGVMSRPDARVVLLQTPALQALHVPRLQLSPDAEPKLEQPLLSRRAVYRQPGAGDWLLPFALRLLADTAHGAGPAALPYRKYYLATLEGLEIDALPYAVPFCRYKLPLHALSLLRDLAPGAETRAAGPALHRADALAHAAVGFLDYARAHPDYLTDELLVV